jgi:ankyrin repeat protein
LLRRRRARARPPRARAAADLVRADENTVRFKALLKAVEEYATRRNLPPDASRKMLGYFEFQHKKRASGSEAVFQQMPLSLRLRIATARYYKLVERARIFYQCNPQFLDQLVMTLRERYLMPSEVCFERGDGSRELLWCASGVLHVTKGDEHIATIRSDLGSPPTIGEIAFILGIVQPYTVAASAGGEVTLLLLDAASFDELIAIFPEQANVVLQNLLRPFGLSTTGEDVGTAVATDHTGAQTDEDGALEWQEMRATVRLALLERNDDSLNQMIRAASDGDVDSVRSLAARGLDLNACNYDGRTTLHLAAAEGNARVVELLCQLGADATIRDRWGNTPIKDAIDGSYDAVIDALRAHGITLEVAQPALLLCEAAATGDLQRLTKLLANGVDPNTGDYDGRTPLHLAAASGNLRVVEFLVGQMADVSVADKSGAKPVDDAIAHQRTLVTQLLIASGSHPDELAMAQRLARAAEIGDVEQAKFLIEMGVWIDTADYDGRTALHLAARAGSLSTVDYLIGAKADMDASDRWGNTPLIDALRASNEAAALFMSNSDAKLPPYCADDPTLRALLACARAQKMTLINRKLKHRAELRAHVEVQKRASKRELRVALKKLADEMVRLYRVSFPLYGLICRSTPRWITSYSATADAELSSDDDDDDSGSDDNSDDDNSDDDSSDDDVDAKSPARSVGGTTELITREAAIETLPPAADAAADADANAASVSTTFTRLVLRLPRAEGGLDALRRAFASRFAAGSLSLLPSAERAAAEARALLALLELDLGLARADCERAVGEVRAALGGKGALDDAKSLSRASQGLYMADVGFACIFASAHLRGLLGRHAAMRQREAAASLSALAAAAAPPNSPDVFARLAGFSRPSATYDADSPVHPEEGSPRADPALRRVQTDAQMARTVLSRWQRPTDAVTQAGENSVSTRARIASLDASYGPATVRRPSILSKLSVTASTWRRPRLSAAADGAAGGGAQTHPPAASPDSRSATSRWRSRIVMGARVEPLSLASEAAPRLRNPLLEEAASAVALIDQLFAVFDSAGRGQIRMRDVLRSQASLGSEMGGAEIKSLINHLRAASAELSSRAGARARVLTRAHFFLGVSSWVLASARDDDDPDDLSAEDAAAAAAARAAKADDDDAEGGRPAEQRRGARGGRLMVESVGPTFDEQLANPAALEALADSIQLRLDFARLRKDDAVDADQLKGLLVNTLALEPRAVQREALERWALRELGVEISARGLMRTHTRRLSPRVPTLVTTRARSSRGSGGSSEQVGAQASVRASAAMTPRSDQPTAARGPSQTALSAVPLGASGAPFKLVDGATLGAPVLRCEWSELALALRSRAAHLRALVGEVVVVDAAAPQPSWLRRVLGYCAEGLGLRRSAAAELARAQGGLVGGAQLSRPWYVVPHDSARLRWFNALINACLCWDLILVPVSLTFFEQTSMMDWFEDLAIAIDSVYVLRMCVRLHTSYVNERSVYVVDPREVRRQYLSTDFTYDLVCSLPLDLLAKALGADRLVVSALRLPRLLLCLYLLRTYRRWEKRQADDDLKVGLLHLLFILLLFAHYCACGWNMLGFEYTGAYTGEGPLIASTWVGRWNALVAEAGIASEWDLAAEGSPAVLLARRYSISLNMSLSMLTTLGARSSVCARASPARADRAAAGARARARASARARRAPPPHPSAAPPRAAASRRYPCRLQPDADELRRGALRDRDGDLERDGLCLRRRQDLGARHEAGRRDRDEARAARGRRGLPDAHQGARRAQGAGRDLLPRAAAQRVALGRARRGHCRRDADQAADRGGQAHEPHAGRRGQASRRLRRRLHGPPLLHAARAHDRARDAGVRRGRRLPRAAPDRLRRHRAQHARGRGGHQRRRRGVRVARAGRHGRRDLRRLRHPPLQARRERLGGGHARVQPLVGPVPLAHQVIPAAGGDRHGQRHAPVRRCDCARHARTRAPDPGPRAPARATAATAAAHAARATSAHAPRRRARARRRRHLALGAVQGVEQRRQRRQLVGGQGRGRLRHRWLARLVDQRLDHLGRQQPEDGRLARLDRGRRGPAGHPAGDHLGEEAARGGAHAAALRRGRQGQPQARPALPLRLADRREPRRLGRPAAAPPRRVRRRGQGARAADQRARGRQRARQARRLAARRRAPPPARRGRRAAARARRGE